jgi:hypothetical protein
MPWQLRWGYVTGRGALDGGPAGGVPVAPVNTVLPAISGTTTAGSTLSTTNGTWTGTLPIAYTYQWKRNGVNIGGATSNTYLLALADLTTTITVVITAINAAGSTGATSTGVGPITYPPATARSAMLLGQVPVVVNTSTTIRDANALGVMINSR